jgi:hypothetical protein
MNLPKQSRGVSRFDTRFADERSGIMASACDGDPFKFKCKNADPNSDQYTCCGYESCCCAKAGQDAKCCYSGQDCWGPCCQH